MGIIEIILIVLGSILALILFVEVILPLLVLLCVGVFVAIVAVFAGAMRIIHSKKRGQK